MIKECLDEQGLLRLLELIKTELSKYVKSVEGKGLSTEDFTTELLDKLNTMVNEVETLKADMGNVDAALDSIITIQNSLIGGDSV